MKRRSQEKKAKSRGTYGRKKEAGTMMYGPHRHSETDHLVTKRGGRRG